MVPDFSLIEIFDFYMTEALDYYPELSNLKKEAWIVLAHVCRKWRDIVFGSPRRLNVRLFFHARRSLRAMLDTWPPLPIDIWVSDIDLRFGRIDDTIAILKHSNDLIQKIKVQGSSKYPFQRTLATMQKPFPCLTELIITSTSGRSEEPVIPDSFLSGSAPFLRSFQMRNFKFPRVLLHYLRLSTNLVELRLSRIPDHKGIISPEAALACLSALTRLETFELGIQFFFLPWRSQVPPPSTRCILPALTSLEFDGPINYLEHLIAPIDSPLLDNLDIILHYRPVSDAPQFAQFIDRTPKLKALDEAHFFFDARYVLVSLLWTRGRGLHITIPHSWPDEFPALVQRCTSSFLRTLIPMTKHLYFFGSGAFSLDDVECSQWLDILRPFTTVENLYLSCDFSPHIVPALHGIIGEGMAGVLPFLQNIFLERLSPPGPVGEAIGRLVTALHLSFRPIAVSQRDSIVWDSMVHDPWWRRYR